MFPFQNENTDDRDNQYPQQDRRPQAAREIGIYGCIEKNLLLTEFVVIV